MANETIDPNFTIDITAEHMATVSPNEGATFALAPFGDFKAKIVDVEPQTKTGDKPHVMLNVTFLLLEVKPDGLTAEKIAERQAGVGMQVSALYAGSKQSPKFMQQRLACLIRAAQLNLQPGKPFQPKLMLVGKELDVSLIWDLGKEQIDKDTGAKKRYVNNRVIGERAVGQPRSAAINPEIDSAAAVKWRQTHGDDAPPTEAGADAAPWDGGATDAGGGGEIEAGGFQPEESADATVHLYRAMIAIDPDAGKKVEYRNALLGVGFDPDGPVNVELLAEPIKSQYVTATKPAAPAKPALSGLPPLNGGPAAPKSAKTGTRTKGATA